MKIAWVGFWSLLVGSLLVAAMCIVALAQGSVGLRPERFKTMSPKELLQSLDTASRLEASEIIEALIDNRESSLPLLHERALTGTSDQKRSALRLMAEMRDRRSVETLLLLVTGDSDVLVRTRAIIVLRDIGDRAVVPFLRDLLSTSQNGFILSASLAALGKLGSLHDIPLIRGWLTSAEEEIRVQAAAALALLGSRQGQDILLSSTRSQDPLVQQWATEALGYLNTSEARSRLVEIFHDPESRWKSYAQIALAQQELKVKEVQEKTKHLTLLTQDSNHRVAGWAVEELAKLGTQDAAQSLRDVASKGGKLGQKAGRLLRIMEGEVKR